MTRESFVQHCSLNESFDATSADHPRPAYTPPAACDLKSPVKGCWDADHGLWTGTCYKKALVPQPDKDDSRWAGHTPGDGVIVGCLHPGEGLEGIDERPDVAFSWAPVPPGAPEVSPRELAEYAVAGMDFQLPVVGSTPPTKEIKADSMGYIGFPVWLWVADPGPNTTGPITNSETDGGLTVTATATLQSVDYVLTDMDTGRARTKVTCTGPNAPGTPYRDGMWETARGPIDSPTCGIKASDNTHAGHYRLTATPHWTVHWDGGGQSGDITVPADTRTTHLDLGEIQVLNTTPRKTG